MADEAEREKLRAQIEGSEWLAAKVAEQQAQMARSEAELDRAEAELRALQSSKVVRYSGRLRRALGRARRSLHEPPEVGVSAAVGIDLIEPSASFRADQRYPTWVEVYDTIDDGVRDTLRRRLAKLVDPPLVSVILPVYNTPESYLREALDSIRSQLYENWQLCVADDASTAAWVPKVLAEYAAEDSRILVERRQQNGHISAASNTAIGLATGQWIAMFDHDDVMAEHALAVAVLALAEHPGAGLLYSDEDHLDDAHQRDHAYFKPDFDPLLLLGQNYFAHLCMLRRHLVEEVGGFREGYEGSQDWDLVLRVSERLEPAQVVHVPHVLYHWRAHSGSTASSLTAKPYAVSAAQRSVADHLERTGRTGSVLTIGGSGFNRVRWEIPNPVPRVSVVVLARNAPRLVRCLDSIVVRSTYPEVELVVVDDGDRRPPLRQFLRDRAAGLTVVREEGDLSDSGQRNAAARIAKGDVLCFVHDDVEVITDRWLEEMVGLLLQPGVGAVGAKLLYPDGSVQHAGLVAGIGGTVGHIHRGIDRLEPGYFGRAMLTQSFSAVSWACMAVRRGAFEGVGGFDEEHLSGAFGDADFFFRLTEAGWRVGWTPHAELFHHEARDDARESDGENSVRFAREIRYLHRRWGHLLSADPSYNPNLSLAHETLPLAWPPRVPLL